MDHAAGMTKKHVMQAMQETVVQAINAVVEPLHKMISELERQLHDQRPLLDSLTAVEARLDSITNTVFGQVDEIGNIRKSCNDRQEAQEMTNTELQNHI